jgi:uncharacterized protein with von Willebrand factor type A (vWA) domain
MDRAERSQSHTFVPMLQDLYNALYQHSPRVTEVDRAYEVNKMALEELLQTSEYQELHATTRLSVFGSTLGTISLGESALTVIERMKEQLEQAAEQQRRAEQAEKDNPGDEGAQQAKQNADARMQELRSKLRQEMRGAAREAQDAVDDGEAAASFGRGFSDVGASEISLSEQFKFAEEMLRNPQLRSLAQRLGRIEILAQQAQKDKMEYVSGEMTNIELGRDLARLLPSELVKLLSPTLRKDWQRRYVEGTLMQYRLRDQEPVGRGPMIVCVDESGSMRGDRLLWAKALSLGLAKTAFKQHRAFAYIPFSVQTEVYEYPDGVNQEGMLKLAKHNYGGGTEFAPPLRAAVDLLDKSEFERGDLVFLTDGDGDISQVVSDWFVKVKEAKRFRSVGILIGADARWGYYREEAGRIARLWDESFSVDFSGGHAALSRQEQDALSAVFST